MANPLLSTSEIQRFLSRTLGSDVDNVVALGSGHWSKAFSFELDSRRLVLRLGQFGEDFGKDRRASTFARPNLSIPRLIDMGPAFHGFYAISERADGQFLDELEPERMTATIPSLFRMLDSLRSVPVAADQGYGGWDRHGLASHSSWQTALLGISEEHPRTGGWKRRLSEWTGCEGTFDAGVQALRELTQYVPDTPHVIHSDLLNRNVLVAGDEISAVFDWGCSQYGDFLYDIAWLTFWATDIPGFVDVDVRKLAFDHLSSQSLDLANFEERLRCYEVHIGLDHQAYNAFLGDRATTQVMGQRTLAAASGA